MTANANIIDQVKGNSMLVRPRFSPGLLLRDDDLKVGVDYTRDLSRLLFRSLFGCGVVCGLRVSVKIECGKLVVTVDGGVALDPMGDPIHVPSPTPVKVDLTCGKEIPDNIWVTLCRTEKCCAPRSAVCGCEEDDSVSVCTREQEGFEIRLVKAQPDDCACMCKEQVISPPKGSDAATNSAGNGCWCANPCDCLKDHYAGKCGCSCCEEDCVILAVVTDVSRDARYKNHAGKLAPDSTQPWIANHSVRRFVRPVLMRDPVVFEEQTGITDPCKVPDQKQQAGKANESKAQTAAKKSAVAAKEQAA